LGVVNVYFYVKVEDLAKGFYIVDLDGVTGAFVFSVTLCSLIFSKLEKGSASSPELLSNVPTPGN
jgi:hypothetical protein